MGDRKFIGQLTNSNSLAMLHHAGQMRRGYEPYYNHVYRVAMALDRAYADVELVIIGFLHDIVEDTPCTLKVLEDFGFSQRVIKGVDAMTKREGESREDYMQRVFESEDACKVKLYDSYDNLVVKEGMSWPDMENALARYRNNVTRLKIRLNILGM